MKLKSKDIEHNSDLPSEFICDRRRVLTQLMWENVPDGTKSFVLSFTDTDFSVGIWFHWLIYDISNDVRQIERVSLLDGAKEVMNTFDKKSDGGPCPPSGTRR